MSRSQVESKRAAAASEDTMMEHFEGKFGLIAELKEAGIMDEDGVISGENAKRILNRDEAPQVRVWSPHF